MTIQLALHYGMCFGVRDALRKTHDAASAGPVTVLGQLVHNPHVSDHLKTLGVREGRLDDPASATTPHVLITAHGAADRHREAWKASGFQLTDTTCPLVRKAHTALATLVAQGYAPVVIGKKGHVEVNGLVGDFPAARVVETEEDIEQLPFSTRFGIVSQTTQPLMRVQSLINRIRERRPCSATKFVDTVCQPTKDRQSAMEELCQTSDLIVVIGGKNSNNTRELVETARSWGLPARHVEGPGDIDDSWFHDGLRVGVTAGTSTLEETVQAVVARLQRLASDLAKPRLSLFRLSA